ncbi:MAG: hypothetical protein IJU41_03620 [Clostridia bacterium]|nr:hypothetical protein [Clostridia bacterium]
MAAATDFNVSAGQKVERKLLVTAVNVGTSTQPEWQIVGTGIEDSSIELNPDVQTVTDITGVTETTVNKLEPKQGFDPFTVRGGSKLAFKLWDIWKRKAVSEFSQFEVLIAYGFVDGATTGTFEAEKHTGCTISVTSIGGSAFVDMPIEISYSNDVTLGSVDKLRGSDIAFTATVSA